MTVSNKIKISWSGIDTNIVKQEIYYSKDGGNFQLLDTVNGSQNYLVIDTTKFPNGTYKFQVKLTDSVGNIFNTTTDSYTFANTVITTQSSTSNATVTQQTKASTSNTSTQSSSYITTSLSNESSATSASTSLDNQSSSTDTTSVSSTVTTSQNQLITIQDNYIYIGDRKLPQALGIAMGAICCISLLIIILPWIFFFISERRNKTVIRERKI